MASSKSYSEALFESKGKKITARDFIDSLQKLGIKKDDVLFVHSDISAFGKLALFDKNKLCRSLIGVLRQTVPDGILIMPAFSYSFESNEPFDISHSKSKVGTLSEYFRTMPEAKRTIHPNHSVCILGKDKELFDIDKDAFGQDSIFGKLRKKKGKILFLGAPFQSLTFVHHIEQMHKVPYRKNREIKGTIINGRKKYADSFNFYSKYSYFFTNLKKFEDHLLDTNRLKTEKIGDGTLMIICSTELFEQGMKLLDKNIYFFVKDSPWPFFLFNHLVFRIIKIIPGLADLLDRIMARFIK